MRISDWSSDVCSSDLGPIFAFVGGLAAVHQFCKIGPHAMIGGMSGVEQDVIPYGMVMGNRARLTGLNLVGLKRRGFEREDISKLRVAYDQLFSGKGTFTQRLDDVAETYAASAREIGRASGRERVWQ